MFNNGVPDMGAMPSGFGLSGDVSAVQALISALVSAGADNMWTDYARSSMRNSGGSQAAESEAIVTWLDQAGSHDLTGGNAQPTVINDRVYLDGGTPGQKAFYNSAYADVDAVSGLLIWQADPVPADNTTVPLSISDGANATGLQFYVAAANPPGSILKLTIRVTGTDIGVNLTNLTLYDGNPHVIAFGRPSAGSAWMSVDGGTPVTVAVTANDKIINEIRLGNAAYSNDCFQGFMDLCAIWHSYVDVATMTPLITDALTVVEILKDANFGNMIYNPYFSVDSYWTKGTGWTISGGKASASAAPAGGAGNLSQANGLQAGRSYEVTFTISNYSAGTIRPLAGSTGVGTSRSANGTFTETIVAGGSTSFFLQVTVNFTGDIDNVSVIEV